MRVPLCHNSTRCFLGGENQRYILDLHLQGLKPKKMAEQIGCTPGAAATLLCRARKALARELGWEFLSEYGYCA